MLGKGKNSQEVKELRQGIQRTQALIDDVQEEQGSNRESEGELRRLKQLKKNYQTDFEKAKKELAALEKQGKNKEKEQKMVDRLIASIAAKESERNTMEKRLNSTKPSDDLKERQSELQRQNKEYQAVIQDENTSPSDKEAAEARVAERNEELGRLQTQVAERERARPLSERIKEIFNKYGVTVTVIFLAAGATVGAVVGAVSKALKATGKSSGNGLKNAGLKIGFMLPGLIESM